MNLENIISIVKESNTKVFAVTINGMVEQKRLYISYKGFLCEFEEDSNRYGHSITNYELKRWEDIKPIN